VSGGPQCLCQKARRKPVRGLIQGVLVRSPKSLNDRGGIESGVSRIFSSAAICAP